MPFILPDPSSSSLLTINLISFNEKNPPYETTIWVTDGRGNWATVEIFQNGSWKVKSDMNKYLNFDFDFEYWCLLSDRPSAIKNKIDSFRNWYKKLND